MITLGVDPGPVDHAAVSLAKWPMVVDDGTLLSYAETIRPDAAVIEWPVSIGIPLHRKPLDETMRRAAILADRLHTAGVPVYIPPRSVILRQLGYSTRQGNADAWVRAYLARLGYDMKLLKNSHLRAAMAAALFNWSHPQNQQYRYAG